MIGSFLDLALDTIATAIEASGLRWGRSPSPVIAFDGSSTEKRVTKYPVDPDHKRLENLQLGMDYRNPPTNPLFRPQFSTPRLRNVDNALGTVQLEPALRYMERVINIHLRCKETRKDHERVNFDLVSMFLENEERLFNALTLERREWIVNVNGIDRGFTTEYESSPYSNEDGLTVHGVYRFRLTYPLLTGIVLTTGFMAKRIHLVTDLRLEQLDDVTVTGDVINVPLVGKVAVIQ
jgi:hypothetical protein